jgi:hypothetical protein
MPTDEAHNDDSALLAHLQSVETELHRPATRSDAARLDALLHEDFREIGRSGVVCTKADVLAQLPMEALPADIVADGFELRRLGDAVVLLTYRSAHRMDGRALERLTLRSSTWERSELEWHMRFQPAAELHCRPEYACPVRSRSTTRQSLREGLDSGG